VYALQTAREHSIVSKTFISAGLVCSQQWPELARPFSGLWGATDNSSSFLSISRFGNQEVSPESNMRASAAVDWRSKYAQLVAASAAEPAALTGPAQLPQGEMVTPTAPPAAAPAPKSNVQGLMSPAPTAAAAAAAAAPRAVRKSNVLKKAAGINEAQKKKAGINEAPYSWCQPRVIIILVCVSRGQTPPSSQDARPMGEILRRYWVRRGPRRIIIIFKQRQRSQLRRLLLTCLPRNVQRPTQQQQQPSQHTVVPSSQNPPAGTRQHQSSRRQQVLSQLLLAQWAAQQGALLTLGAPWQSPPATAEWTNAKSGTAAA
jgi:hypothetical protein